MEKLKTTIIACINNHNVIGSNNQLLYKIHDDLERFKRLTTDNIIIMGRKTYETLPHGCLSNRINIVLTKNTDFCATANDDLFIVHDLEMLQDLIQTLFPNKKIFVIGGAKVYQEFLEKDLVECLELTQVFDDADGDAFFPSIDYDDWQEVHCVPHFDEKNHLNYEFITLVKRSDYGKHE